MPNKKLTDKEIVKALECVPSDVVCNVGEDYITVTDILDLINRLQAENERLRKDKQPMIVNSIQDDFCGVPCEFMEEKINHLQADIKRFKADIGTLESKMIVLNALIEMKNDTIGNQIKVIDMLECQLKTAKAEIDRLNKLAELGNMRANDYRVMRDRALKAEKEVERLQNILICFMGALGKVRNIDDIESISVIPLMTELNKGIRAEIKTEAYKECIEKVKEKSKKTEIVCSGALVTISYAISNKNLDNLLKELVGEDNA